MNYVPLERLCHHNVCVALECWPRYQSDKSIWLAAQHRLCLTPLSAGVQRFAQNNSGLWLCMETTKRVMVQQQVLMNYEMHIHFH